MASSYEYTKKSIEKRREFIDELKNRPCKRCGINYPPYVMEWHHRDRATKKFGVGRGSFRNSIKMVLLEIEKCDLYCANCHRIIEHESGFYASKGGV